MFKTFNTTQNNKTDQITMNWIDLMSKRSKQRKITNAIKLRSICIDLTSKLSKMLSYIAKHSKQRKTTKVIKLQWIASIWWQKHQTNAKLQKWSYYDEIASIWRQNDQNNAKLQNGSNYNELHRFDVKTIKNVELRRKTFKTTQNYKTDQIIMYCIDLMSKR